MGVRGIRGAITIENDTQAEIVSATKLLLEEMVSRNGVRADDIASVFITTTEDIKAAFPAQAARLLDGWQYVPLMCAREIPVPGSLPRCIRVMMHVNTSKAASEIHHVFMRDAVQLRPDLSNRG
ncbi:MULTISPECIES: chorismate mutase [Bacillales]|jgi:chorismate mutase|uniref:chorismate mutase n=1 Tax=Brevibacillus aydinogluensis TaxID=927786 RepID=A0AA48MAC1_9BACL|nr:MULTISPECIES: chorismate mutase [Bacillales]REK62226.1 MAG: chorismate mutase [Brevibacillus sp.]MBR8658550.1 chorismate mutase [Brevibacillus sp. NL20B1]MDT3415380.1 chorismate mutase [Brevibacillus aydinogluensis]NNV02143.1 chorismate mutase [Brevibacillus sp. MCWH]UFJ60465.1 chorismate mutase [Anoxybacillus sediminis]